MYVSFANITTPLKKNYVLELVNSSMCILEQKFITTKGVCVRKVISLDLNELTSLMNKD